MIIKFLNLKGKEFFAGAIMNNGAEAFLCGNSVKLFDCNNQKYLQTVSKTNNANVVIAHNQRKLCLINASKNDHVTIKELDFFNSQWIEKKSITIKGSNIDGGRPQYSNDDQDLIFSTQANNLWRYNCDSESCEKIWNTRFSDQIMAFDVYNDTVLISLGTSDNPNHSGFDVLKPDGSIIRSLRYDQKEQSVVGQIIRAKWLNQEEIIIVYQLSINSQYDIIQRINWRKTKDLLQISESIKLYRPSRTLFDFQISPNRQLIAFVWLNWNKQGALYHLGVYSFTDLALLYETDIEMFSSMIFSENSHYLLVCSLGSYFIINS